MTEFSVGNRVLVPGVVVDVDASGVEVDLPPTGHGSWFRPNDLRPDTGGRDLTINDLSAAYKAWDDQHPGLGDVVERERFIPEYLTRIARGDAGSAGDDTAPPAEHMRVQDAIEQRLRDAGAGYEDEPWFADVIYGATEAAIAAAGPRAGDTTPDDGLDVRSEIKRMIESNDRLRSEVAALRDAGNTLADRAWRLRGYPQTPTYADFHRMEAAVNVWRSAAGEATT